MSVAYSLCPADLECFDEISRDETAREIFLRMAALSRQGRLEPFLTELERDEELDEATKGAVTELAQDEPFLLAVERYIRSPRLVS